MNDNSSPNVDVDATSPAQTDPCPHHWLIEPPGGPTSKGVCRICGEERAFENYHFSSTVRQWGSNS